MLTQKSEAQVAQVNTRHRASAQAIGGWPMNTVARSLSLVPLAGRAGLAGCAGHQSSEQALQGASADFQKVKEDTNVLRIAPKDVIRAGESLARADRLSSYCGSAAM